MKSLLPYILFALAILIYFPSFHAPFQLDDGLIIIENTVIRKIDLAALWHMDPSRFLTHLTFAWNYYFGQLNVFGYHIVNFLLHLCMTCLVFYFFKITFALEITKDVSLRTL